MPQMGVSVAEGTVVEWRKRVGDWVQADETICEISTDKIDSEVPAPASGRVTEILVDVGATVPVQTLLARIDTAAGPGGAQRAARRRARRRPRRDRRGGRVRGAAPALLARRAADRRRARDRPRRGA